MIDQRFPTYHEKLTADGFEPKRLIRRNNLGSVFQDSQTLEAIELGLLNITLVPGDRVISKVPEGLPRDFYVLYERQEARFNSRFKARYKDDFITTHPEIFG